MEFMWQPRDINVMDDVVNVPYIRLTGRGHHTLGGMATPVTRQLLLVAKRWLLCRAWGKSKVINYMLKTLCVCDVTTC